MRDHAIFLLDGVGRVAYWSPAAAHVLGFSDNEALRRPFSDFFTTEDQQTCHPEQVLKEATRQGGFERTGWCVRCNGERFWAELNLARLDSPDASGFTVVSARHQRAEANGTGAGTRRPAFTGPLT